MARAGGFSSNIKTRIMIIMVVIFAIVGISVSILNVSVVDEQVLKEMQAKMETIITSFNYNVEMKVNDLKIAHNFVINDKNTRALFAKRDREQLTQKYSNLFEYTLKPRFNVNIFQFHVPPATSFLRIHKIGKFGDDLSRFRKTVVRANQSKTVQAGIEVGKYGASIRVVYPVDYENKHIGTVELGADYLNLMDNISHSLNVNYAVGIYDDVLKSAGFKLETKTIIKDKIRFYHFSNETVSQIIETEQLNGEVVVLNWNNQKIATSTFPLIDFSGSKIGTVVICSDITETVDTAKSKAYNRIFMLLLMITIIAIFIYFSLTRFVFNPLNSAVHHLETVSSGDLTDLMEYDKDDEIGRLSSALNNMIENLRNMVTGIRSRSEDLTLSAKDFSTVSTDMMRSATDLSEKSTSVASAAEEMNTNMSIIASAAEESSSNIQNITTTSSEMSSTVTEISQSTAQAQQISNHAVEAVENASLKINRMGESAEDISRVIDVINDIADQTKLLALNATIEAARAGEAGKGFAVVANEVKELARQTSEATQGITEKIQTMQGSTRESVSEINKISEVISSFNEIITGIASAVEEQAVTTQAISENIRNAAQGVADVTGSVNQVAETTQMVVEEVESVNASSNEVESASSRVKDGVQSILKMSQDLQKLVKNFRLQE